ncbi:Protein of unknown function [Pyronema omphalodes CBS 100304]|uniref:Uncharacterized protein n=1 Tax=Pyronema omphalodes (strain CBS 100304) TaxID=1076935 RepID=U4LA28_PYROM|nr:Protein of unknown function [Pyronema omphalodes CBS 100304]
MSDYFHQLPPGFVLPHEPIGQPTGYFLPTYYTNTDDLRYFSPEEFHAWTTQYARVLAEMSNRVPPVVPPLMPAPPLILAPQLSIPAVGFIPSSPYAPTHDPIFNNPYTSWVTAAYDFSILLPGSWDGADRLYHTDYYIHHVVPETTLQWIWRLACALVMMGLGFVAWFASLVMLVIGVLLAVGLWVWMRVSVMVWGKPKWIAYT